MSSPALDFCRFCLESECFYLRDIFDARFHLSDKIFEALSTKVARDDELPNKICEFCICNLTYIQEFKRMISAAKDQITAYTKDTKVPLQKNIIQKHLKQLEQHVKRKLKSFSQDLQPTGNKKNDDTVNPLQNGFSVSIFDYCFVKMEPVAANSLMPDCTIRKSKQLFKSREQIDQPKDDLTVSKPQLKDSKLVIDNQMKKRTKKATVGTQRALKTKKIEVNSILIPKSRKKHTGGLICELCGKRISSFESRYHMNKHNGIYPFKCQVEGCESAFIDPYGLNHHKSVHNSRNYICALCKATFKDKKGIRVHMYYHMHPTFSCKICGRMVKTGTILNRHMKVHTGERPYKCDICKKTFVSGTKIRIHMNVHTGAKNYVCVHCGMAYAFNRSLKSHLAKIHSII